jgi:AraC-like DNA-binding protein
MLIHSIKLEPRKAHWFDLYYVAEGEIDFIMGSGNIFAKSRDFCCFPPGTIYGIASTKGVSVFHCHAKFPAAQVRSISTDAYDWTALASRLTALTRNLSRTLYIPEHLNLADTAPICEAFVRLIRHQRGDEPGFLLAAEAQLILILHSVSKHAIQTLASMSNPRKRSAAQIHVSRALDYIAQHKSQMISLVDVADKVGINPEYLSRIFRSYTKMSVGEYITVTKMDAAKERLLASYKSIKQVAASLGYRDQLYFSRQFRNVVGVSPQRYLVRNGHA